jgi:hypothetical protein
MNMNQTSSVFGIGDGMNAALVKFSREWTFPKSVKSFEGSSVSFSLLVELALMVVRFGALVNTSRELAEVYVWTILRGILRRLLRAECIEFRNVKKGLAETSCSCK